MRRTVLLLDTRDGRGFAGQVSTYLHGHQESVLRAHRVRTAENSAAYLVPHLVPGLRVLDLGCGPATITVDLARLVAPGEVVGVDASAPAIELARAEAAASGVELTLVVAAGDDLPFDDDSFDVVHAHQVLQHVGDPVAVLREMRRVTRPGGLVAVRDADYAAMTWHPASQGLDEWRALYHEVAVATGGEPDAGRHLRSWALAAGFAPDDLTCTSAAWCYATDAERDWWSQSWAERVTSSTFARHARDHGLADDVALEELAEAWRGWGTAPDGWFAVLHSEVLGRV